MPNIDLSILNQRQTPAFYADVFANRPAAGFIGRIFVSTDTFAFFRDNGTGWDLIGGPGTGTITGSGATGQIALWDGTSTITGDTGLTYNGTDNSLTASKFIVTGGTSSQFLKADGSVDSSSYVPYTGATANVNLGAFDLTADLITGATGSFTSSGGSNTFGITHSSGSGIALNISKDGNGEGLFITKGSGTGNAATINGGLVRIENNSNDAQLQIVSSIAPSLRIDNASTGATRRIGLGLATASNNFIQGTTGGELCLFNSSTTPSPILFGIYDTATSSTIEAGRVSPLLNFLLGQTTDTGEKLQVTGNVKITGTLSATSLGITGGTANTLLATNGSTINAGTNITISGGTISAASTTFTAGAGIDITGSVISSTITQYTDANARASLSAGTGISYNSSTGQISSTITQYTDANARASLSFSAGSGAYNSSTGVITIPTNTNQLTNGSAFITLASLSAGTGISYNSSTGQISSTITQYTDANARASLSAGTGISYNSSTGQISSTITQYTDAQARASLSAGTGISYNSSTGQISSTITQYTDANARASLSFSAGSGAYNSSTGVITIPTNTNQLTNGSAFITLASLSGTAPVNYNSSTGAIGLNIGLGLTTTTSLGVTSLNTISGTYTPTILATDMAVGYPYFAEPLFYTRVGNVVNVYGAALVGDPGLSSTYFKINLPISSNINSSYDLIGVATTSNNRSAILYGSFQSGYGLTAIFEYTQLDTSNEFYIHFSYQIS